MRASKLDLFRGSVKRPLRTLVFRLTSARAPLERCSYPVARFPSPIPNDVCTYGDLAYKSNDAWSNGSAVGFLFGEEQDASPNERAFYRGIATSVRGDATTFARSKTGLVEETRK